MLPGRGSSSDPCRRARRARIHRSRRARPRCSSRCSTGPRHSRRAVRPARHGALGRAPRRGRSRSAALPEVMAQVPGVLIVCIQLTANAGTATAFSFTTPPGGPAIPSITVPANTTAASCTPAVPAAPGTVAVTEQVPRRLHAAVRHRRQPRGRHGHRADLARPAHNPDVCQRADDGRGPALTVNQTASPPTASMATHSPTSDRHQPLGHHRHGVTVTDTYRRMSFWLGDFDSGPATAGREPHDHLHYRYVDHRRERHHHRIRVVPTPATGGATLTNTVTATSVGLPGGHHHVDYPNRRGSLPARRPTARRPRVPGRSLPLVPPPPLESSRRRARRHSHPTAVGLPRAPPAPSVKSPPSRAANSLFLMVGGLVTLGGLVALRRQRRRDTSRRALLHVSRP